MANFVSPGVYVIERDDSAYTPAVNPTVVGVVGFADKGPTNKATLITSQENLIQKFGEPREDLAGQGIEGALEILETCNQMYFVRAVDDDTAKEASAVVVAGACPVIGVSAGDFGVHTRSGGGAGSSLYLKIDVANNAGVKQYTTTRSFSVPSSLTVGTGYAATQAEAMRAVLGGSLDADDIGSFFVSSDATLTKANPTGRGFNGTSGIPTLGNFIVGSYAGSGAYLSVSAFSDAAMTVGAGVLVAVDSSGFASGTRAYNGAAQPNFNAGVSGFSSITAYGWSFDSASSTSTSGFGYLAESIYPGAGYNASTAGDGSIIGNSVTIDPIGGQNFNVQVNNEGVVAESFKASLVASGIFIEDVINTGSVDLKSAFIKGNLLVDASAFNNTKLAYWQAHVSGLTVPNNQLAGTGGKVIAGAKWGPGALPAGPMTTKHISGSLVPRFSKFVEGTRNLVGGANGDGNGDTDAEATALIGKTAPSRTGMQALNDELVPITLGIVPGITDQRVQNNLITLAETTGDFLAVFGTPIGIGDPGDAINYANGQTSTRTSAFNSSYACLYYPAVKVFQSFLGKDVWMDPAIFAVRQMGYTDTVADLWFAPAGFNRGRLTKPTDTEVDINQGDRDSLYSGGNIVNPIVNFVNQGITIFGQRTTQRAPTALDRINVRRLMVYLKRLITASTQRFVFEPNDKITQETIRFLLEPALGEVQRRRGITEFKVICDETVNTPERVDRNELWCKVLLKPTKAAEVLVFELNITNQSANLT